MAEVIIVTVPATERAIVSETDNSFLLARGNHTGTQAQSTVTGLATDLGAKETPAGAQAKVDVETSRATAAEASVQAAAVQRVNHTGTQLASTVSDFSTAADARIAAATDVVRPAQTISVGPGLTGGGDLSANRTVSLVPNQSANNWGLLAQSFLPSSVSSSSTLVLGVVYVIKVIAEDSVASGTRTVRFYQATTATGITLGRVAVFDSAGVKLGTDSADQSASWNSGGSSGRSVTVGSFALTKGSAYYIAFLAVGGTTGPAIARAGNSGAVNINLTGASLLWSTNGTSATDMPASIVPASNVASPWSFWVGLV